MLYAILKFFSRLAIRIFCRRITVNRPSMLRMEGPILLASNHPNSFLDSIIMDTIHDKPVWSLARGDVFKKRWHTRLLHKLKILPVYRNTEGTENLSINYRTFDECLEIFRQNGIVMIFSEAKSINEWHLRPLKKGTARLCFRAWDAGIPLRVLPVGINYSSFRKFGKNVFINFGDLLSAEDLDLKQADGFRHQQFNSLLTTRMQSLVMEIPADDVKKKKKLLSVDVHPVESILLALPALVGAVLHAPLYLPLKKISLHYAGGNDHYDSVLTALLFLLYPVYSLLLFLITLQWLGAGWALGLLAALPSTAWCLMRIKPQLDG